MLFGQLRRWSAVLLIGVFSGALILACGPIRYSLNPNDGYLIAVVAQTPLLSAIMIQAASISPLQRAEERATRSLRKYRVANYALMTVGCGIILGFAASLLKGSSGADGFGALSVVRNLCALLGASYVGASMLGTSFGWAVPAAWTILPYVLLTQSSSTHEILTLVTQPDSSYAAFVTAAIFWLVGLVLVSSSRRDVFEVSSEVARLSRRWNAVRRDRARRRPQKARATR